VIDLVDMKLIKGAFAEPSRELSCNITIEETVYNDDFIEKFKIVKGLSEAKEFEVGTAFMSSINLKMVDKLGEFNKAAFKDKTCKVEIGVKTSQGVGFVKVGEYLIDSVGSDKASWTLKGYDKMCKFNVKYDCKLDFPTTLKSIVLDICKMCGVEPSSGIKSSTGVLNKTIKYKPNFYEMTCREVLAQVAELCCGWAYIDTETQKLEICSGYSSDSDIKINDDNLIVFKELKSSTNSDTKIQIDSVKIIQKGADDADYNANSPRKFHIIDNIWIQGNGHEFLDYATKSYNFSELSALSIKYNGNPALENNKFVAVNRAGKIYRFLPLVRRLTYSGGLVEECECPQINYDPTNRRKDLVRHIEKISATLRVMDEKIQAKVGTEEFATLVEQTKEEIKALAKSINLTGYVKFEDLKKVNGTTEINGGNITTGVIQSRDGGFGIDLDNKTFFLGRDLEHYALLFDGRNLKFGAGGIKSEHFSEGLKQELKGKDGQSQYVHTRYSDTGGTTGAMFIEPSSEFGEPHKYIGFAITSNKGAPALKSAYTWSKYIGEDGSKGNPGEPGTDGKTPYFHIAWADNESGSSGFTTSGGNDKAYMGTYTDFTERDSEDYRKYTWVKVKGDDGKDGKDGKIKYNLISNGDFHNDFTKDEPSDTSQKLNEWQVAAAERMKRVHILPAGGKWIMAVKASDSAVEVNQYLDLKDNTKYYVKFKATSNNMSLYYYGDNYVHLAKVTELDRDNPKVYSAEFTTHKVYPHKIQFDCRQFSEIHWIILSESPIPDDIDWYPSKQDSIGKQGPPGRDGKQGPPGKDGSMVDLPPALKDWNGKATEISGKYVFTPELFVGNGLENKTGIYIGENIRAKFHDRWQDVSGMVGMENGQVNWMFTNTGNLVIGSKIDECIQLGADGRAIIPMIKTNMIEAGAITADKIRSGEITTDFLYPGTSERIILERGYSPGANDCKSIDANGDAIRLKVNAGTYIAMKDSGSIGMYSGGSQFFSFNPNQGWDWGSAGGDGVLNLYDAHVITGWLEYYVYSVRSDRRVKDNIKYIKNNDSSINRNNIFNFVKSVDLATYQYKKIGGNNLSMIAQDVQRFRFIQDYLVVKDSEGLLSINMGNYHSMVHIALQEEIKKREALEDRVGKMEEELAEIKKLLREKVK
jgi:hypothetical protein